MRFAQPYLNALRGPVCFAAPALHNDMREILKD